DAGGNPLCITNYIVGIADRVTVTDVAGNQLRRREADVDCTTGNVTENRRFLANGSAAITDMTYDGEGKLTAVTGPANLNGERYSLTYNYDTTVDIYVEKVTDSFGYFSTSTHDFRFGEVTSTTDENAQVITNSYDNFGRLIHVTGPYEQGTVNTTIDLSYAPLDPTHPPPPAWPVRADQPYRHAGAAARERRQPHPDGAVHRRPQARPADQEGRRGLTPGRHRSSARRNRVGPGHLRPVRTHHPAVLPG